jgi:SLAP domain-containing protein
MRGLRGLEMKSKFEKLYDTYYDSVYRYIYVCVKDKWNAEDIISTVFFKIYENRDKIQEVESSKNWVFRIAHNAIIDFYRKNGKVIVLDDWKIGFDTRLQAKSYADIEFEGIPDGISEENRFVLDTFLKGLPRIERGQISFSKFNLALTPEGEFDISIVIRNGADKGINIERIPVKLKDDNDNTVFAAEFQLKDLTVSSNKARLVNLKALSNLTSTGTVDLNGCKLLFEK